MKIYNRLAMQGLGLSIYAECDADTATVRAVVCDGGDWRLREEISNGAFDLAFSRVLADLRRRLNLTNSQMVWLESHRYRLGHACRCSDAAA